MIYQTAAAFRRALETRLLDESRRTGVPLVRLRKLVAFDRFLVRLLAAHPQSWMLKGGLALQLRIGSYARTTQDVDVLARVPRTELRAVFMAAVVEDLGDWFTFQLRPGAAALPGAMPAGGERFFLSALVDARVFENFHVDVGFDDPVVEAPQDVTTPPLLAFAGIQPATVPCYPVSQHLAEKLHAYLQPHPSGEGTRVKDLVDIVLIATHMRLNADAIQEALTATFAVRQDVALPRVLPAPPASWSAKYHRLAREVGLAFASLADAYACAAAFMNPILAREARGDWAPEKQSWQGRRA